MRNKITNLKADLKANGYDTEKAFELLSHVKEYIEIVADYVREWFEENLPDYNYRIKLEKNDNITRIP